jgi:hypothetical protein
MALVKLRMLPQRPPEKCQTQPQWTSQFASCLPPSPISSCERSGNVDVVVEMPSTIPMQKAPGTRRPIVNGLFPRSVEQAVIKAQPQIAAPIVPYLGPEVMSVMSSLGSHVFWLHVEVLVVDGLPAIHSRNPCTHCANTKAIAVNPARVPTSYSLISPLLIIMISAMFGAQLR